jgi:uncharacterized membrane protein YfcA
MGQSAVLLVKPLSRSRWRDRAPRTAYAVATLLVLAYSGGLQALQPGGFSPWIMAAVFAASLISSIAGFAFSAICGAMLFHLIDDPVRAVQIMMICSIGGQTLMVWSLRRQVVWKDLFPFLLGALVGLPAGLYILLHAKPAAYAYGIGILLIGYATFMLLRRPVVFRTQHQLLDVGAGLLGGITGGAAAFPGAFVTIWCGCRGWTKERQRGIYQPFILIVQSAAVVLMLASSPLAHGHANFDFSGVAYLPAMLLGASLGMVCFSKLNDRQFAFAVNLLLIVSGVSFLI